VDALLKRRGEPLAVGGGRPPRVMAILGANASTDLGAAEAALRKLQIPGQQPDIIADVSLIAGTTGHRLWKTVLHKTHFVAATVPAYSCRIRSGRLNPDEFLATAAAQMEAGVGLLTIHPVVNADLLRLASSRLVPCTSRGGGIVLGDFIARGGRGENTVANLLADLVPIARRTGTVLSLGAAFRAASIAESMDAAETEGFRLRLQLARQIAAERVPVLLEGPGHLHVRRLPLLVEILGTHPYPLMPLGPVATDISPGEEHVAAAIGSVLLGSVTNTGVLACVTRSEHSGGIPTAADTAEAVRAARLAAHVIEVVRGAECLEDTRIAVSRALGRSCVANAEHAGCSRCGGMCPLTQISRGMCEDSLRGESLRQSRSALHALQETESPPSVPN